MVAPTAATSSTARGTTSSPRPDQPYVWSWVYPCGNCAGYEFVHERLQQAGYLVARTYPDERRGGHLVPDLQSWAVDPYSAAYTQVVQRRGGIAPAGRTGRRAAESEIRRSPPGARRGQRPGGERPGWPVRGGRDLPVSVPSQSARLRARRLLRTAPRLHRRSAGRVVRAVRSALRRTSASVRQPS